MIWSMNKQSAVGKKESISHSALAGYFKEVVYGGVDGIVTTFAIVSGFTGAALGSDMTAQASFTIVLLFGLANLFADAVSMGLGNFLSVRSERHQYDILRAREQRSIQGEPQEEIAETVEIMKDKGFSEADAYALAHIYSKNEDYWLDFMMAHEYEVSDPRGENPILTGFTTFGAFLLFGAIPILPFVVLGENSSAIMFQISTVGTFLALVLLGLLKWRLVGTGLWRSLGEIVLVGSVAAIIAFAVGTFFKL